MADSTVAPPRLKSSVWQVDAAYLRARLNAVDASGVAAFFDGAAAYARTASAEAKGLFPQTAVVQWAVETGYDLTGSPAGSDNLAGLGDETSDEAVSYPSLSAFVAAYAANLKGPDYAAVLAATTVPLQMIALGQSPWAASHYAADGTAGELLMEVYQENQALIDGLFATAPTFAMPTLKSGDTGMAVKVLQRLLNDQAGFALEIDGEFGPDTLAAVNEAKKDAGLPEDGTAGVCLWDYLVA